MNKKKCSGSLRRRIICLLDSNRRFLHLSEIYSFFDAKKEGDKAAIRGVFNRDILEKDSIFIRECKFLGNYALKR